MFIRIHSSLFHIECLVLVESEFKDFQTGKLEPHCMAQD